MKGRMQARSADDGFSLVEVLVALGLAMTVLVAVLPQLVVGIRAGGLATVMTEAKGVIQGHFEKMRSLPYHVAPSATPPVAPPTVPETLRRIDVLDTYFPDLTGPSSPTFGCQAGGNFVKPSLSWSGYVSDGTRCPYEPANAFYRKVELLTGPGGVEYVLVTNTQFLASATSAAQVGSYAPEVATPPASGYDSQNKAGLDVPVTSQIGVTVTAFFLDRGRLKPVTAYSQISENKRAPVRAQGKVTATSLDVGSTTPGGTSLTLSAGVVNISGLLSSTSNVNATVAATSARESTEPPAGSIIGPVVAPYQLSSTTVSAGGHLHTTCGLTCWDATAIDAFTMSATGGLPNAGVSSAGVPSPLEGRVTDVGPNNSGIRFANTRATDRTSMDIASLRLDPNQPLVRLTASSDVSAATCGTSRAGKIAGRGFLHTTATHLETCAEAATSTVSMFPTTFAPDGVVRVTLFQAVARCTVRPRVSQSATYSYGARVEYKNPVGGVLSYTSIPVSGTSATVPGIGPLPSLDTIIHQEQETLRLRDYIESWSTPTASTVSAPKTTPTTAEAALSGVVKVLSKPIRKSGRAEIPDPGDPSSVVSLSLGAVGCYAEDAR